jgi:hypothetical protein
MVGVVAHQSAVFLDSAEIEKTAPLPSVVASNFSHTGPPKGSFTVLFTGCFRSSNVIVCIVSVLPFEWSVDHIR